MATKAKSSACVAIAIAMMATLLLLQGGQVLGARGAAVQWNELDSIGAELAWCIPKTTASAQDLQNILDYACSQGADCQPILPGGQCFAPDTLYAHAAYAANDYWQNMRAKEGTCDFAGTATLTTTDPSYGDCHYPTGPLPAKSGVH